MVQCNFVKSDCQNCSAQAMKGDSFCFSHSENEIVVEKREQANKLGGERSVRYDDFSEENVSIQSVDDVVKLLESTINAVRKGKCRQIMPTASAT